VLHFQVVAIVQVFPTVLGVQIHNSVLTPIGIAVLICVIKRNVMVVFVVRGMGMVTVIRRLNVLLENQTVLTTQEKVAAHVLHSLTALTVPPLALVLMVIAIRVQECAILMIHVPPLLAVVATVSSVRGRATVIAMDALSPDGVLSSGCN